MTGALAVPTVKLGDCNITTGSNGGLNFIDNDGHGILFQDTFFCPSSSAGNGVLDLGHSNYRWATLYATAINVTRTTLADNLNADLLDGHHGDWYQNNVLRFRRVKSASAPNTIDLNSDLDGGGIAYNLYGTPAWGSSAPSGVGLGAALAINPNTTTDSNGKNVQLQLCWGVNGRMFARNYNYATASNPGYTDWREFAFTDSNVASATKLATARRLWGVLFDGSDDVSGNMTGVGSIAASGNIVTSGALTAATSITVDSPSGAATYIKMTRSGWNYIMASVEGGALCFLTDGASTSLAANSTLILEGKNGRPGTANIGT